MHRQRIPLGHSAPEHPAPRPYEPMPARRAAARVGPQSWSGGAHASLRDQPLHVLPVDGGWAVQFARSGRPVGTWRTKRSAVSAARQIAKRRDVELVLHSRDGRMR